MIDDATLTATTTGQVIETIAETAIPTIDNAVEPLGNGTDMQVDESDARHELVKADVETVVEDVVMPDDVTEDAKPFDAEPVVEVNSNNDLDHPMDADNATPVTTPGVQSFSGASNGDSTTHTTPTAVDGEDNDEDKPRPAKRPRVHSDADQASIAHPSASPPPTTTSDGPTPVPTPTAAPSSSPTTGQRQSVLGVSQHKFCSSTVRSLKKLKDAKPFLYPVDTVLHNIPHYNNIIKTPMDLTTIERKLLASNPSKPDPNPENPRYFNADEFAADVRLIFTNCFTFNGLDNPVSQMAKRLEEVFDKQIRSMPPANEPTLKRPASPQSISAPPPKKPPVRRQSTTTSASVAPRRIEPESAMAARPKREAHVPPPRDLQYAAEPPRKRKAKRRDDNLAEDLNFCSKVLNELHAKRYKAFASFFYEPVDPIALNIPDYFRIIKKPMDLSSMRRKLDGGEYTSAKQFWDDFKLMLRNCFTYNPSGTPVNQAGQDLQKVFDEKWGSGPPEVRPAVGRGGHDDSDDSDHDMQDSARLRQIAEMEAQVEAMKANLASLKAKPQPPPKKPKAPPRERPAPVASTSKVASKPPPKAAPPPTAPKGKPGRKAKKNGANSAALGDDDTLSFDQKKLLSEGIATLEESKLERVIAIIHEGMPEIKDSNEEIELEIDLLPASVLTKLFNFVIRPTMKANQSAAHREIIGGGVKRGTRGKGTGTGGLKRKSMDEDVEAEKIRQLEERMALFDNPDSAAAAAAATAPAASRAAKHGSDSSDSSGSDSSGSDSE